MRRRRIIRSNCKTWILKKHSRISITRIIRVMLMASEAMTMARRSVEGERPLSTKEVPIRMRVAGRTSLLTWVIQLARLKERPKILVRARQRPRAQLLVVLLALLQRQAPRRCQLWTVWSKSSKSSSKLGAGCKPSTQADQAPAQSATRRELSPSQSSLA